MPLASEYWPQLRERLLLDWDDPVFRGPLFVGEDGSARKKLADLASARSEDAVTWNVFRTLGRLPAQTWLPAVLAAFSPDTEIAAVPLAMTFWQVVRPPSARLEWLLDHLEALRFHDPLQQSQVDRRLDKVARHLDKWKAAVRNGSPERGDGIFEGPLELDVVLSSPGLLAVVEGRCGSDIPARTPWDPQRDHIGRCLDATFELAGPLREPYLLLVTEDYVHHGPDAAPHAYETLLPRYRELPTFRAARLPHRSGAELARLEGHIGWLSWADLVDVVLDRSASYGAEQKRLLRSLVEYLKTRRLLHKGG